jgi:hypothetical protein
MPPKGLMPIAKPPQAAALATMNFRREGSGAPIIVRLPSLP